MPMPGPTSPVWTSAATLPALRHSAPTPSWVVRFSPYERGYHLRAGFPTQDTRWDGPNVFGPVESLGPVSCVRVEPDHDGPVAKLSGQGQLVVPAVVA